MAVYVMKNGKTATANFISGMSKSLPPMTDLFAMTGLTMPELVRAKEIKTEEATPAETEPNT